MVGTKWHKVAQSGTTGTIYSLGKSESPHCSYKSCNYPHWEIKEKIKHFFQLFQLKFWILCGKIRNLSVGKTWRPPDAPSSLSSSSSSSSTSSTSTTGAAEVALRDLCEMHGHKIYVFLPQVFQREEMRLERDCKVHPHSGARSAVQIQCPHGHDCRYVKMSAAGASRLVNNPIVVCGQEGPRYLISHQYECQQCLTSTFIFS